MCKKEKNKDYRDIMMFNGYMISVEKEIHKSVVIKLISNERYMNVMSYQIWSKDNSMEVYHYIDLIAALIVVGDYYRENFDEYGVMDHRMDNMILMCEKIESRMYDLDKSDLDFRRSLLREKGIQLFEIK